MKRELVITAAVVLVAGLLLFAVGCSGTRPQPTTEEKGAAAQPSEEEKAKRQAEEDEVLKLLGIAGTEKSEAEPTPQQPTPLSQATKTEEQAPVAAQPQPIETQISQLEQQLGARETEAQGLKSELMEKEQKLSQLQTQQRIATPEAAKPAAAHKAKASPSGSYKERYEDALALYENRRYKEATDAFEALLAENSTNSLADNCQYWMGECYYALGNYSQAIIEFEKVFSFSSSNKSDAAQLKLGLCYLKLGDKARAREELQRLLENYPKSEYVSKAKAYLSQL